jgi:hypothetical protein
MEICVFSDWRVAGSCFRERNIDEAGLAVQYRKGGCYALIGNNFA